MPNLKREVRIELTPDEKGMLKTALRRDLANQEKIEDEQGWSDGSFPKTTKLVEMFLLDAYRAGQADDTPLEF